MRIRKLFRFENAHVVRNCSSDRCKYSIHGHSYRVELILEAFALDQGHMVYDFGLLKGVIRELFDSFDHALTFWEKDDPDYIAFCRQYSARWISLPVSPSAEQFARVLFFLAQQVLDLTVTRNGEADVRVYSVIVHETETGYAQAFAADIENAQMGPLALDSIHFSEAIRNEWRDPEMYARLQQGQKIDNPAVALQVAPGSAI